MTLLLFRSLSRWLVWATVVLGAVGGVLLYELGLLLAQVGGDSGGYTPAAFSAFRLSDGSGAAFTVWNAAGPAAGAWVCGHLVVDTFVFAPAVYILLAGFLWIAGIRSRATVVGLPLAALAADLVENGVAAQRWATFVAAGRGPVTGDAPWALLGVVLSDVKWVLVGVTVVLGVLALAHADEGVKVSGSSVTYAGRSPAVDPVPADLGEVLRPQLWLLLLTSVFVVLIAFPGGGPLDQIPDVIRAQSFANGIPAEWGPALALLLLAAVTVSAGVRADVAFRRESSTPWRTGQVLLAAGVLGVLLTAVRQVASGIGWENAGAPFATLVVCGVLAVVGAARRWMSDRRQDGSGRPPGGHGRGRLVRLGRALRGLPDRLRRLVTDPPPMRREGRAVRSGRSGTVIGMLPALVLLAAAVGVARATARNQASDLARPGPVLVVLVTSALVGLGLAVVHLTAGWLADPGAPRWTRYLFGGVAVVAVVWTGLLAFRPDWADLPRSNGTVALAFATLAVVLGELVRLGRSGRSWVAFRNLGLKGAPWAGVLVSAWLVAGLLSPTPGYHLVRTMPGSAAPHHADLAAAFGTWDRTVRRNPKCAVDGTVPLVLVAAPGGGIRAAQWTAAGLDLLSSGPCGAGPVFAVSGVSGGSLGATVWAAARPESAPAPGSGPDSRATRAVAGMSDDRPLAGALAGLLLRDPVAVATGTGTGGWRDRAAVVEDEMVATPGSGLGTTEQPASWAAITARGDWAPVLALNAHSVTDGCRVLMTNTGRLSTGRPDCQGTPVEGDPPPAVPSSVDARTGLVGPTGSCADGTAPPSDLPAVTAGLVPARFPVVTPTAGIRQCRQSEEPSTTYAVDGGYGDNSALGTLLDIAGALRPLIASAGPGPRIALRVVLLDNHYRSSVPTEAPKRPREFAAPLDALSNRGPTAGGLEQQAALFLSRQAGATPSEREMTVIAPQPGTGVSAPLGWVLAGSTNCGLMEQMDGEWTGAGTTDLRSALGVAATPPAPGRADAVGCP